MDSKKRNAQTPQDISVTPSTLELNQLMAGRKSGMLSDKELELLRKSQKEISDVCQKIYQSKK